MIEKVVPISRGSSAAVRRMFLNEYELEALDGLVQEGRILAYVMYVSGFRWRMDYQTGTVGDSKASAVSVRWFQDMLERRPRRGSKWSFLRPSRDEVRGEITALEKAGLLRRLPKRERFSPLRFLLPLADSGQIRAQEEPPEQPPRNPQQQSPAKTHVERGFQAQQAPEFGGDEAREEPPITESITTTTEIATLSHDQLLAVDMDMVMGAYHDVLPGLPKLHWPSPAHQMAVARVWYAEGKGDKHQCRDFWCWYFGQCAKSDFLMGRVVANPRKGLFKASFAALLRDDVVVKVINGEYT